MPPIEFIWGPKVRTWGGWYRHASLRVNGAILEGCFQEKRKNRRTTLLTVFREACVLGHDWRWLARQNGLSL